MIKISKIITLPAFLIVLLTSCTTKINIEDTIASKRKPSTKFVIILSPDTRCPSCYNQGFTLGRAFEKESIIVTTNYVARGYDRNNIVLTSRDTILELIPKHYQSLVIPLDGTLDTLMINPVNPQPIGKILHQWLEESKME